jgi:hypothetical protein
VMTGDGNAIDQEATDRRRQREREIAQ